MDEVLIRIFGVAGARLRGRACARLSTSDNKYDVDDRAE